jgi:hypothetical protein
VLVVYPARATAARPTLVDLRNDSRPIGDLERMLDLHDLCFGSTPDGPAPSGAPLWRARRAPRATGYRISHARPLRLMGRENFEERWRDGKIVRRPRPAASRRSAPQVPQGRARSRGAGGARGGLGAQGGQTRSGPSPTGRRTRRWPRSVALHGETIRP